MNVKDQPYISFIIPVYNSEQYLQRCLDSILGQSYQNIEIICIDDGSTDGSGFLLEDYAIAHENQVHVYHQENHGIAATRNTGIRLAQGKYLAFIDNDDWIDSDWASTLQELASNHEEPDVICSGYRRPNENGNIVTQVSLDEQGEWSPYLIGAPWAKLYRTDYVRGNNLSFFETNIGEDLPFVIAAVSSADKIVVSAYSGYNWFYNTSSVSNTIHKSSAGLQFEKTLNKLLAVFNATDGKLDPFQQRYLIRLIAWYLFYTRKGDGIKLTMDNVERYSTWLDVNVTDWRKCKLASPFRPSGDPLIYRIAVWLYAKAPIVFKLMLVLYSKAN